MSLKWTNPHRLCPEQLGIKNVDAKKIIKQYEIIVLDFRLVLACFCLSFFISVSSSPAKKRKNQIT